MPSKALQIICMAVLAAQDALAADDSGELTLTVQVYDYSGMPAVVLENAMAVAQRIFHDAGIATRWIQCGAAHEPRLASGCPEILGSASVVLNVVRNAPPGFADTQDGMGSAQYDAEGGPSVIGYVFRQRVEQNVKLGSGRFQVLGHVMAHEVGHLLLGAGSHSETGIMRPHWSAPEIARDPGGVTFSRDEAQRILVNIGSRMQAKR